MFVGFDGSVNASDELGLGDVSDNDDDDDDSS